VKAMILAAGRGERLGRLTADIPKPLLTAGGESLIERHLRRLSDAGFSEIVINLSYLGEQIRNVLGEVSRWGQTLIYSEEGTPALETGGGIVNALPLLQPGPFLVVNADIFTEFDFAMLHYGNHAGHLVLVPNPPEHEHGDFGLASSGIVNIMPPLLTYSGIAILTPEIFRGFAPGHRPLRPILDAAIEREMLEGSCYMGMWSDVGTPDRLAEIREVAAVSH
jgi:MurNAc alpha-1-phosphate uridylyltransferase